MGRSPLHPACISKKFLKLRRLGFTTIVAIHELVGHGCRKIFGEISPGKIQSRSREPTHQPNRPPVHHNIVQTRRKSKVRIRGDLHSAQRVSCRVCCIVSHTQREATSPHGRLASCKEDREDCEYPCLCSITLRIAETYY